METKKKKTSLLEIKPESLGKGNTRLSEEIDEILYLRRKRAKENVKEHTNILCRRG
jgi:hypothetical protein